MSQFRWFLSALVVALSTTAALAEEPRKLFNGKDLTGWVVEGPKEYKDKNGAALPMWTVKDGLLTCAGRGFGFLRYDHQQFADFALHVEYRMAPKGNSGIGIRTVPYDAKRTRETRPSYASYEIQLLDDAGKPPNKHSSGSLYRYVAPKVNAVKPAGEWNIVDVECTGPRIRVTINDQQVLDVDQSAFAELKTKPLKGYICLQSHTNQVEFRNVHIRQKKAATGK